MSQFDDKNNDVIFCDLHILPGVFDGVSIHPFFKDNLPHSDIKFEYRISNPIVTYNKNNTFYFNRPGESFVFAKGPKFSGKFKVFVEDTMNELGIQNKFIEYTKILEQATENSTICFGDSFFEFWRFGENNVVKFDEEFKNFDIYNIGISASTISQWNSAFNYVFRNAKNFRNLVINLGINDIDNDDIDDIEAAARASTFIQNLINKFPKTNIYWITPTHCADPYFNTLWQKHQGFARILKEISNNIPQLHILDLAGLYGENYKECEADGLHPNQTGYNYLKQLILENVDLKSK